MNVFFGTLKRGTLAWLSFAAQARGQLAPTLGTLKHRDRIIMRYMLMSCCSSTTRSASLRPLRPDGAVTRRRSASGHYGTPLLSRDSGSPSYWVEYVICVDWALSTLLAEAST